MSRKKDYQAIGAMAAVCSAALVAAARGPRQGDGTSLQGLNRVGLKKGKGRRKGIFRRTGGTAFKGKAEAKAPGTAVKTGPGAELSSWPQGVGRVCQRCEVLHQRVV